MLADDRRDTKAVVAYSTYVYWIKELKQSEAASIIGDEMANASKWLLLCYITHEYNVQNNYTW